MTQPNHPAQPTGQAWAPTGTAPHPQGPDNGWGSAPQQWGGPAAPPVPPYGGYPGGPVPPAPQPPRKRGIGKKIGIGVLVLIGVIILSNALGGGRDSETSTPAPAAAPAAPVEQPAVVDVPAAPAAAAPAFPGSTAGDVVGAPGATLTVDDVAVTTTALEPGDDTFRETLCSTVTYVNNGSSNVSYNLFDWSLLNPSGSIVNASFFGGDGAASLSTGELTAGGRTSGQVCFENEQGSAGQYVVLYDGASFFSNDRAAWINER